MTFKEFLLTEETEKQHRLSVYRCPFCGGDAYDGEPGSGFVFKGSIQCSECSRSCAAFGQQKISENGPLVGKPPQAWIDMCKETDRWLSDPNNF